MDIQTILDKQIKDSRKDSVRDNTCLHASDLGVCPGFVYQRIVNGFVPEYDSRTLRVFEIGTQIHDWIEGVFRNSGDLVSSELSFNNSKLNLKGRCDAIIRQDNKLYIVDFKTMNSMGFHKGGGSRIEYAKPHHARQVCIYKSELQPLFSEELIPMIVYISKDDACLKASFVDNIEKRTNEAYDYFNNLRTCIDSNTMPGTEDVIVDEETGKYVVNWVSKYCPCHDKCTNNKNWLYDAENRVKLLNKNNADKKERKTKKEYK